MRHSARGLLGGVFDPIHNGHLYCAQVALDELHLDSVNFIVSARPPHKSNQRSVTAEDRAAMVELAVSDNYDFLCDERELQRNGPSYTIETLATFEKSERLVLIIGADNILEITKWYQADKILERVELAVVSRPGATLQIPPELSKTPIHLLDVPVLEISSSFIRSHVKHKKSWRYMVPPKVYDYISRNKLYRE